MTWVFLVSVAWAQTPRPHGTLQTLETQGVLAREDVEPIVAELGSPTAYCVALSAGSLQSPVHYRMNVRNGRVIGVEDVKIGDLKAPDELSACLARKIGSWPFPSTRGDTTLDFGFTIEASTDGPDPELGTRPIAAATKTLADAGRIYQPDPYVRAALDGSDPCEAASQEFDARRCADTREALVGAARKQLAHGFVVVPVLAEMGAYDFEGGRFPVRIEPLLVTGGIGTPNAPGLTLGHLAPHYPSGTSSDYDLMGGMPLVTQTAPMGADAAEALVARTDRELVGIALVRLQTAYDVELRTGSWETKARSPASWAHRERTGEARAEDLTVTWYAVDVDPVAVELYDPATGAAVSAWLAEGYGLAAEGASIRLVEPASPEG